MPGPKLDGASVYELLDTEKVTYTAGVPTVWLMLLNHMATNNLETAPFAHGHMRRLGDAAFDDQVVRRYGRRGPPRLGHDRDEPARHTCGVEAAVRRTNGRGTTRYPADPGLSALRRADEDHRRCRQGVAVGRQDLRPAQGLRTCGVEGLFPRRHQHPRRATAISTPAMSRPSIRTATCGSPIAPRT